MFPPFMKYSKDIFCSFPQKKQGKKLLELITKIEGTWQNREERKILLIELQSYLTYMKYKIEKTLTDFNKREFLNLIVPIEQEFGKNRREEEIVILKEDNNLSKRDKIPLILILDNLRSAFNVGSIFRTAECFGVSHVYLCGYTPTAENKKVQKTAMGTVDFVRWEKRDSTVEVINELKKTGTMIYALETTTEAVNIREVKFKKPTALLLGNEALGLDELTLNLADEIIQIELSGWKNSLNVGVCAAVCCYEISRQW
ncbi:MAG: RNA methyltransferase [Candidatus Cloacimonetes bacterium]|nr:RNA methyltransferase [Candidatus Cloacimonadota bacterium]